MRKKHFYFGLLILFIIFYALLRSNCNKNDVIVYHKVQKTGSTTFSTVLKRFSASQNYSFINYPNAYDVLRKDQEAELVNEVGNMKPKPAVYIRFFHFIDFASYGAEEPLFFSIIRDPIKRFVSYFNYIRYDAHNWGTNLYEEHFNKHWNDIDEWRNQSLENCIIEDLYDCQLDTWQASNYLTIPYFCGKFHHFVLLVTFRLTRKLSGQIYMYR